MDRLAAAIMIALAALVMSGGLVRDVMAEEAGFATAVSAISGIVDVQGRTNLRALPRIGWDGRRRSMRMMRVLLSGATFADVLPTVSAAT